MDAKKLKSLRVSHNKLESLPPDVDTLFIEEVNIQHNSITKLPEEFLQKANKYVHNIFKYAQPQICEHVGLHFNLRTLCKLENALLIRTLYTSKNTN